MYPWPYRHSASRGRWEDAEVGVENPSSPILVSSLGQYEPGQLDSQEGARVIAGRL